MIVSPLSINNTKGLGLFEPRCTTSLVNTNTSNLFCNIVSFAVALCEWAWELKPLGPQRLIDFGLNGDFSWIGVLLDQSRSVSMTISMGSIVASPWRLVAVGLLILLAGALDDPLSAAVHGQCWMLQTKLSNECVLDYFELRTSVLTSRQIDAQNL